MNKECLTILIKNGLIDVLAALILSLLPQINLVLDENEGPDIDHKAVWFDAIEPLDEQDEGQDGGLSNESDDDDAIFGSTLPVDTENIGNSDNESDIIEELSNLDFQSTHATPFPTFTRPSRATDEQSGPSSTPRRESSRRRADSFIHRSDSRQLHRGESRTESFLGDLIEGIRSERTISGFDSHRPFSRTSTSVSVEHQQLRRISRSMSISMQQTKSTYKEEEAFQVLKFSDIMIQLLRHSVVIFYRIIHLDDKEVLKKVICSNILPILASLPSFLNTGKNTNLSDIRKRTSLAVTSGLMSVSESFAKLEVTDEGKRRSMENSYVYLKHATATDYLLLSSDKLTVSNENWYFGTVVANQAISKSFYDPSDEVPLGWYFELQVFNDGIMQIGIAEEGCKFDGKKGVGVGDTIASCGFDGARCKMWNGPSLDVMLDNDYGMEWQAGDTISVLLSWGGVLSYRMNGKDLGPALSNMDTSKVWYPALSLSVDQYCKFTFKRNNFSYQCPDGYETVEELRKRIAERNTSVSSEILVQKDHFEQVEFIDVNKKNEFMGTSICLYYEVDISNCTEDVLQFGFVFARELEKEQSVTNLFNDETPEIKTKKIVRALKKELYHFSIGCGISLPHYSLFVTLNGQFICECPMDIISNDPKHFFNLIPFIDQDNLSVNFGSDNFYFAIANSITIKFQCFEHISKLIDQIE